MATTEDEVAKKQKHVKELRKKIHDERRKNANAASGADNETQLARLTAEENALQAELESVKEQGKEDAAKRKTELKIVKDTAPGEPVVIGEVTSKPSADAPADDEKA